MRRLLIIDDDPQFPKDIEAVLSDEHAVTSAQSSKEGLALAAREAFDVVLLDIDLNEEIDGLDVLQKMRDLDPDLPVIMVSRTDNPSVIVKAGRLGATDFVTKGASIESLSFRLRKALEARELSLHEELRRWQEQVDASDWSGTSEAAKEIARQIDRMATTSSSVLITGCTGVGKEVVARSLHAKSPRSKEPFVAVNCASIPENLAESTFFGHEKGAFTGATSRRRGCFELADGGTLFLDEFTEMRPDLQPKLLRAIETGEIQRVGSERTLPVDVRVIAATNRDVEEVLKSGSLREDIYYRLAVLTIHVPPLSERLADIPFLARLFAARKAKVDGKQAPVISPEVLAVLSSYEWPGNVRELRNVIERAVVLCDEDTLRTAHLTGLRDGFQHLALAYDAAREAALARFERDYVTAILTLTGGKVTAAAARMGMSRQGLYQILQKHAIDPERYRG